jgi:addiction module HigA family antidote
MAQMFNPAHPGRVLKNTVLRKDGGISVTEFAKHLKVSRVALSRVINEHAGISPQLAIRLAMALGGSAESWLTMQLNYDLWHQQKKSQPKIQRLMAA